VVGLHDQRDALDQPDVAGEDLVADGETLDVDLDALGQVRRLGLDRQRVELGDHQRAHGGLTDEDHGNVHRHLLTAAHEDQVRVLDEALDRVALDLLGQGELATAARELDRQQRVGPALERQHQLVARQRDVHRLGAVSVEDRRDLVGAPDPARGALAELGTRLGLDLDLGHGELLELWVRMTRRRRWRTGKAVVVVFGEDRERTWRSRHRVDHGALCGTGSLAEGNSPQVYPSGQCR
jgi:hypothetical protein